jgi:heat shock protein HtpX
MYSEIRANKNKTIFIMAFFVGLVAAISYVFGKVYRNNTYVIMGLLISSGYALFSYFAASKMATSVNGAREVTKAQEPRLYKVVEDLAITNGMPMPKVYVMDDPALNAFATGRDPNHAVVCATSGILEALSTTELQGVMAHELGHVKNYDIRVSMMAMALAGSISFLCDMFWRISFFGGGRDKEEEGGNSPVFMILSIATIILAPIAATMLQLAISRKREYLADATGALTTRYPEGLASALQKIKAGGSAVQKQNTMTAHLFISNPLKAGSFAGLFSTHPPIDERISRLRSMGNKL